MRIKGPAHGLAAAAIVLLCFALFSCAGMEEIRALDVGEIDLTGIEDGVYQGEFGVTRWLYDLEVTVESGKITGVTVIKGDAQGGKGSRKLNDKMSEALIETQNITFDAVSGASLNTKVFQKAVAEALSRGE